MTDDETWVDGDHANTLNRFDVGDTRTTHVVVNTASTLTGGSGSGTRGWNVSAEKAAGGHLIAETFSVYPEGGNGADDNSAPAGYLIPFAQNQREEVRDLGDQSGALTGQGTHQQTFLAQVAPTLTQYNLDSRSPQSEEQQRIVGAVHEATMSVRRLTPVECERLMGLPDGWTAPEGVKAPDSKRYAACGDAIVTTVAFWIADRIRMIEEEEAS